MVLGKLKFRVSNEILENQLKITKNYYRHIDSWTKYFSIKIFAQSKHNTDNISDKTYKSYEIFGLLDCASGKSSKLLETQNSYEIF